jgi:hypothetical protein
MGLDITAISGIVVKQLDPFAYEFHYLLNAEVDSFYVNPDFPEHAAEFEVDSGMVEYIKSDESQELNINAGSYSTYNKFRNLICLAVHGIKVETAWDDPGTYHTKSLWALLNFSDCEGVIDSVTSESILFDLKENREKFIRYIINDTEIGDMDVEHYTEAYDNFIKCFELGAYDGVVIFG